MRATHNGGCHSVRTDWRRRLAGRAGASRGFTREPVASAADAAALPPTTPPLPPPPMPPPSVEQALRSVVSLVRAGQSADARRQCLALAGGAGRPYAEPHFVLGVLCSSESDHAQAEVHYLAALAIDPHHAASLINLGQSLLATGRAAQAVPHLSLAARLAPTTVEAHLNHATALAQCGQHPDAR